MRRATEKLAGRKRLIGLIVLLITMFCINITVFARSRDYDDLEAWWGESDPYVARCTNLSLDRDEEYQFRLYRNGTLIVEKETSHNYFNFESYLKESDVRRRSHVYFRVRVVGEHWKSDWAEAPDLTDDDWDIILWDDEHRNDYDDWDDYWNGYTHVNPDGWFQENDGGWYFYINKTKQYGWISDPGRGCWYYCDRNTGRMKTGWQYINGYWYYLKTDYPDKGRMITGWLQEPSGWYYLDPYTDPIGKMVANEWKQINGYWYYFGSDGLAYEGEHYINGNWYYFFTSYYYGRPECSMAANMSINGHYYDANGRRVN